MKRKFRGGTHNEKEKMEQSFGCAFGDGDSRNTSFRLWREECGKEDAETITVYLWTTNLYEKYAPYIQVTAPGYQC